MRSTSLSTAGGRRRRRRRRRRQQQQQQQQQWLTYSSHLLSAALRDGGDDDVDNAYLSDHDADAPEFQACGLVWKLTATPFKPAPEYLGLRLVPVPKPRRGGGPAQALESEAEAAGKAANALSVDSAVGRESSCWAAEVLLRVGRRRVGSRDSLSPGGMRNRSRSATSS